MCYANSFYQLFDTSICIIEITREMIMLWLFKKKEAKVGIENMCILLRQGYPQCC